MDMGHCRMFSPCLSESLPSAARSRAWLCSIPLSLSSSSGLGADDSLLEARARDLAAEAGSEHEAEEGGEEPGG